MMAEGANGRQMVEKVNKQGIIGIQRCISVIFLSSVEVRKCPHTTPSPSPILLDLEGSRAFPALNTSLI